MATHELFPPELRSASAAEQLAFLLKRRDNLTELIQSLERLQQFRNAISRKPMAIAERARRLAVEAA
jgi:hypothetical protein